MLKPLLLPQMVEERRKRESMQDAELYSSPYGTRNSSASDITSPVTPTFSARGHLRYSSSASSMDVVYQTPMTESPASPSFDMKSSKRSLPDVQEEPHEREDFDMYNDSEDLYGCLCDDHHCTHQNSSMIQSSIQLSSKPDFEYDLSDGFFSDGDIGTTPRSKKRRAEDSPFAVIATRIGTRFPSFSRRWRTSRNVRNVSNKSDGQQERIASGAASSRSSSLSDHGRQRDRSPDAQLPPTPTKSIFEGRDEASPTGAIDIAMANRYNGEQEEAFASTPLLPPMIIAAISQEPLQSPLQSPSVADTSDPFSGLNTPIDAVTTPQLPGIPSPPLSTKPSISSFHGAHHGRPSHLLSSSDIPPILLADENDEWANKLGHANFTIQPEPYIPYSFDIEACRQLRFDWDLARTNYTKHLVRTGEHYGVTSKTYKMTEEKWAETESMWKKMNDITIQSTASSSGDAFLTLKHTTLGEPSSNNIMTKIPSLNDPLSEGKFPQLGDEDIVGPMVQAAAQLQRTPSKKAKLMRFFAEKFPTNFGRA